MFTPRFKFFLIGFLAIFNVARAELPARPEFGVLDRAEILPLSILKASERLIAEHERLTQEQVSIYTVGGLPKGEAASTATAIAEEWRKTSARPLSSVLLLVDADRGELEIRTGFGLDPVLPADKISEIRKHFFKPEWRAEKKSRGLVLSFVEVLRSLGSPLIAGNEATGAFEQAGFSGGWTPVPPEGKSWTGWFFALLGLALSAFVLALSMIREVHYTASGWFRVTPAQILRRFFRRKTDGPKLVTGGGVSGTY